MRFEPDPESGLLLPRRRPSVRPRLCEAAPQQALLGGGTGADPYYASVTLLMHFEGADASTTFTDVKGLCTFTAHGNAQIDTAQSAFGSASGLFDGNGDYLTAPGPGGNPYTFTTGDFTIEAWIRPATIVGLDVIASCRNVSSNDNNWQFYVSSGVVAFQAWGPTPGATLIAFGGGGAAVSANAWTHVAVCRSGNNWYTLHSGSSQATTTVSGSISSASNDLYIGKDPSTTGRDFDGWIDEFRITKGVARYTGAYPVPSAQFPNF